MDLKLCEFEIIMKGSSLFSTQDVISRVKLH